LRRTVDAEIRANSRRRLAQEHITPNDAERALGVIDEALSTDGPLTRRQLASRIAAAGIRTEGQAAPHLLMLAALRGKVVLGPVTPQGQAFVLTNHWLAASPVELPEGHVRDRALAELARRYLVGHGPASPADLAAWSGLPLRDARVGLGALEKHLVHLDGGLVDLAERDPPAREVPPRLLPSFDPYLLGWRDRSFALPAEYARRVHPGGGTLRAVATADGLIVGTWSARRNDDGLKVRIDPYAPVPGEVASALQREAADVTRFDASGGPAQAR